MRTIIIGDVHGCRVELDQLLDRVQFACGDRLIFVGDLVARGPDSLGVLDIARRTGAIIVRGNHEQKLLDWRDDDDTTIGRLHIDLARQLRPVDWTLLETSPLFFDLPEHGACVVHAGVVPGVPLEEQEPEHLLNIRTIDRRGEPAFKNKKRTVTLWATLYEGPPHLIFGHNALPGLQLHPWATGLDTGCVYGGRLTAMVLGPGDKIPRSIFRRQALFVSQRSARVYFESPRKRRVA